MEELFQKYKLKAEKGDANAQVNLGWHYENGEGVPRDYVAAYAWLDIAQINADEDALDPLLSHQTLTQILQFLV